MYKYKLGLLGCMAGFNQLFVEFKGALTGQFVCQELKTLQDYKFITIQMIECLVKLICGRYIRFDCFNRGKAKSLKTYYEKFSPDTCVRPLMGDYKKRRLVSQYSFVYDWRNRKFIMYFYKIKSISTNNFLISIFTVIELDAWKIEKCIKCRFK